jgi:VWFA-related protein
MSDASCHSRWQGLLVLPALLAIGTALPAQSQRQFRAEANLVVLDVSVIDRNRQPVRGLTQADFAVTEAGAVRPIEVFEAIEVATKFASPASWLRDAPTDVDSNDVGNRRLVVLVLDDSYQGVGPLHTVKTIGDEMIAQLGPSDLAAVVYTVDSSKAQDFTPDRARLRAAVDKYNLAHGFGPLVTLKYVVDHLTAVPDRRKTVFFVSTGYNLDLSILAPSATLYEGDVRGEQSRLFWELRDVFRAAQRANVTIYTIDPGGLRAPVPGDLDPGRNKREFLQVLAGETGGRAVVLHNEPQQRVPELFEENGSYYLIGFPPIEPLDGHYRHVRVRVNRDDVEVRTRAGYYANQSLLDGSRVEVDGSGAALAATLPDGSLPMRLASAPFVRAGRSDASVVFALAFEAPIPDRDATETVEAEIGVFDERGRRQGLARPRAQLALRPGRPGNTVRYQLLSHVELKPGRYHLRVAARARERDLAGTLFGEVTVPDFAREALSLSGVILHPAPPPVSAPPDGVAGIVPLVPTAGRTFAATDRVEAYLQVIQGGSRPPQHVILTTRVLDGAGSVVFDDRQMLDAARFDARKVDHTFALPLGQLSTGPHLLTIEAAIEGGPTVTRQVRFDVR